ncbi:C4-dicarboxylate transporter DctA [Nocardiopsis composta]|uniref:Aerobic C4-dicarboxylate transport protein n=1 Tax=Nocardiopsis composta TaxID=157465 RepID=A0A7W8VGX8_9ACTN|nr:C4-dicarboxylate transporter DctA [Nocardiopsis composta]MBB5435610.1 aerobic C4-dicarboxylate transport protein [Nocardiopsis composta]
MAHEAADGPPLSPRPRKRFYRSLFFQVIVAVIAGVLIGHLWPAIGEALRPLGDGFIRLIKMAIAPLIFCVIVTGIAKVGDLRSVGRIGVKALVYFQVVTAFALVYGMVVANVVRPGAGFAVDPAQLDASAIDEVTQGEELPGAAQFLMDVIPESLVSAFAENALLQVLFFSVFFALALASMGERGRPVLDLIERVNEAIFVIIGWIMRIAPVGAFGAMAFVVGAYGLESLSSFGMLVLACYGAAVLFLFVLALIAKVFAGVNLWKFLRYTKDEFALAIGAASSEAVMPRIMQKLTAAGCSKATTGLVIPTGYSFNLDGAAIYLSIAGIFLAQAFGVDMTMTDQLMMVLILLLTSKGMAGVPGSAFLALSATATALGAFPAAGVALLLGADRLMDTMRVSINLLGNCVATFVVARWEGQLDMDRMRAALDGRAAPDPAGAAAPDPAGQDGPEAMQAALPEQRASAEDPKP